MIHSTDTILESVHYHQIPSLDMRRVTAATFAKHLCQVCLVSEGSAHQEKLLITSDHQSLLQVDAQRYRMLLMHLNMFSLLRHKI